MISTECGIRFLTFRSSFAERHIRSKTCSSSIPLSALLLSAFAIVSGLMSPAAAAPPAPLRTVEGITEYRLENGLQILLFPDVSRPTVTVNLTVFVGSRHEGYGEAGMAHLLEHMVFKGTPTHKDIPALLKQRGAQFNGTTSLDRTNYFETLPASDDNLEFALKLEADRLVNSFIKGEDLASEMTVVRNEFERGENSPQRILMQRVLSAAFDWHNYGKSTIGNRADIERVPVDSLNRFYQRFYQPDNVMLIIAGKFDAAKALELTTKHFGAIPKPERQLDRTYTEEPAQDGERLVTVRRVGQVAMVNAAWHIPSGAHPDFAACDVLSTVLASEPAGRLYEALVKRRIAASMFGFSYALHDPGVIMVGAEAAQGTDGPTLLQSLVESVEGTTEKPFTDEEIERARQELLRQREIAQADSQALAVDLSDWASQGDWRLYFLHRDRLEKVTAADVQRVAKEYLTRSNRTGGIFEPSDSPQRVPIPSTPEIAGMIGDYKGRQDVAQGEAFDSSPLAIEARLARSKLKSGVRVTLLPKKTRGASVDLRLTLRYGNLSVLKGKATAASYLPEMLVRGTKTRTRQQISDELDKNRAQLQLSGDSGVLSVVLQTKRENLLPSLQLIEDILRNPVFPSEELELLREEQIAAAGQQLTEPTAIARTEVQKRISIYPPDDPRYVATLAETIERTRDVKIDQIQLLYSELLGGANGELTIVGDFDAAEVTPVVDRITAGWKSAVPFERMPRESVNNEKGDYVEVNTPDKANAAYFAAMTLAMRDDHPDYPALAIGNFILGGGGLSSRLANRVRQKEGLSYTVQSALQASPIDERSVFYIFAISNPENSARVHTVIQEEIGMLLKDGVKDDEFQNAKTGYLKELEVRRSSDQSLAATLETYAFIGRDMKFVSDFEKKIQALTAEDVNQALKKYIQPKRLYIVSAGDFARVKGEKK